MVRHRLCRADVPLDHFGRHRGRCRGIATGTLLAVLVVDVAPVPTVPHLGMVVGMAVARESVDVVPLGYDRIKFVETVAGTLGGRRIIWINFDGTLLLNSVAMGPAAFGRLILLFTLLIHVSS